jgi:hypothetical protein
MVFVKLAHILFGYECLKKKFNNISHLPQMQSDAHILTENPVYHASCIGRGNLIQLFGIEFWQVGSFQNEQSYDMISIQFPNESVSAT